MLTLGRSTRRATVALVLVVSGAVAGLPVTASTAAAAPARSVPGSPCAEQAWGPYAHTISVSGNGEAGAKVARTLANNMLDGAPPSGAVRSETWTPPTPRLTAAALRQVRKRQERASYFRAVDRRAARLVTRIRTSIASCPDDALILIGYSQGALELRSALARIARRPDGNRLLDHVGGVFLVGDPGARPGDHLRRYGVQRQRGQVTGARLPRRLTKRELVVSWCGSGDPMCSRSKVSTARAIRAHRSYPLGQARSAGRRAADRLMAPMVDIRLEYGRSSTDSGFVNGEAFSGWPVVKPLTGPAAELRLDRALSEVPSGMTLADDLTLSGTAPTSGSGFQVVLVFHHARFAPATHRRWYSPGSVYPVRAGRAGVSLVSHGPGGVRPDGDSYAADVSTDGQTAVFVSDATNLVPGDTDGQANVFVWDRAVDQVSKVSDGLGAGATDREAARWSHVSSDGRRVTWLSAVDHPALGDTDGKADVFLYDRDTETTRLASPGTSADVTSATLVADGTRVYFREALSAGQSATTDATVRAWDVGAPGTTVLAPPPGGIWLSGGDQGEALVLSANGRYAMAYVGGTTVNGAGVSWDLNDNVAVTSCTGGAPGPGGGGISDDGTVFSGSWTMITDRMSYLVGLTCDHGVTSAPGVIWPIPALSADGRLRTQVTRNGVESGVAVTDRTTGTVTSALSGRSPADSSASAASRDALTVAWDATAFNVVETPAAQRGTREIYLWDRTVSP